MSDSTEGKDLAKKVLQMVNVMCNEEQQKEFVNEILNSHRTLQQSVAGLFLNVFAGWAEMDAASLYDLRNESTVKLSTKIQEVAEDHYLPFI